MTTFSTLRACNQARFAPTPNGASKPSPSQPVAPTAAQPTATPEANNPIRLALLCAGLLLAAVSIALAAQAGWHRGASLPESVTWAAAGVALAIVSLTALSAALASHGTARKAALATWCLSLAFVIVAGLGSQHGGRELATRTDSAATGGRARHQAAYDRASAELAALPAARPVGVLANELAVLLKDTRLQNCSGWLESKRLRTICVEKVEPLRAELETAKARTKAQQAMDDAAAALAAHKPTTPANSDATAVARYLAAVGLVLPADRLADLISLLTVIAIELCGSVAIALGRRQCMADAPEALQPATADSSSCAASPSVNAEPESVPAAPESTAPDQPTERPSPRGGPAVGDDADQRRARVVQALMAGALVGTQESIAGRLGLPKTTMRRLVETDARLRLSVGPQGSRLELGTA